MTQNLKEVFLNQSDTFFYSLADASTPRKTITLLVVLARRLETAHEIIIALKILFLFCIYGIS